MSSAKSKAWTVVWYLSITFAVIVAAWLTFLFWPWPTVHATDDATLVDPPKSGVYEIGDIVRWTKSEVCQPAGLTTVTIRAVTEGPGYQVATKIAEREFVLDEAICRKDNPTAAWLPGMLFSGEYRMRVDACVENPSPKDRCITTWGPTIQVKRTD